MRQVIPDFNWYAAQSKAFGLPSRCPFASVNSCPRYYQSLSLLAAAGSTNIEKHEDSRLMALWKNHPLWPATAEQRTSIDNPDGVPKVYSNFCPEVTFDRFGYFATHLGRYADEVDSEMASERLAKENAPADDPRWNWASVAPQHFAGCPLYSPLSLGWPKMLQQMMPIHRNADDPKLDVFISHASEDKQAFVRDLAAELTRLGLTVWFDEATLKLGDNLREKIDDGLARARYGVVVLSHSFFAKHWPKAELEGLFAREMQGRKVILPIWHKISQSEILEYSPMLAGKVAALTDEGPRIVAEKILDVVRGSPPPDQLAARQRSAANHTETPQSRTAKDNESNETDAGIQLVQRVRNVFLSHGVEFAHVPRFLTMAGAPFRAKLTDLQTNDALLTWLDDEKIDWLSKTFLIRREWLDGEDAGIHEKFYFDKHPSHFLSVMETHLSPLASDDSRGAAEAYFVRDGSPKQWEIDDRSEVFFILAVPIVRLSAERLIYRYICDFTGYPWKYERCNIELRAYVRCLTSWQPHVMILGRELSQQDAKRFQSNHCFLREIIHNGRVLKPVDWHPDDYAYSDGESAVAKDLDRFRMVLDFMRRHKLPPDF